MKFTIRDLMWLTVVVALAVAWAIDHWRPSNPYRKAELKNDAMEEFLRMDGYEVVQDGWSVRIFSKTDPNKRDYGYGLDPEPAP